jgi:branched-chain amino acid transport system permease protein
MWPTASLSCWALDHLYPLYRIEYQPFPFRVISGPIVFVIGYFLHWVLFRYLRKKSVNAAVFESNSILVAFGLMFIIQNLAKEGWGSQIRSYTYLNTPVEFLGTTFGANRLIALGLALAIGIIFYIFLPLRIGKAIRASAQDSVRPD